RPLVRQGEVLVRLTNWGRGVGELDEVGPERQVKARFVDFTVDPGPLCRSHPRPQPTPSISPQISATRPTRTRPTQPARPTRGVTTKDSAGTAANRISVGAGISTLTGSGPRLTVTSTGPWCRGRRESCGAAGPAPCSGRGNGRATS